MTYVGKVRPLIEHVKEEPAKPKVRYVPKRRVHYSYPQDVIDEMRAEYESLVDADGVPPRGTYPKLAHKYGIPVYYVRNVLRLGLRDSQRQLKKVRVEE